MHERDDAGGQVPAGLTADVTVNISRMRGTDHQPARCAALTGKLGERVACGIYEWCPSPCREFAEGNDSCQRVRHRHGLPTL